MRRVNKIKHFLGIELPKNIDFVPLGMDCSPSHWLRKHNLRQAAYPFDWNVIPIKSAISLLGNKGADFLNNENLAFLDVDQRLLFDETGGNLIESEELITPVLCRRYQILFPHDFDARGEEELETVRSKYEKRFERLFGLLSSDTCVVFILHEGQLNDWQQQKYIEGGGAAMINDLSDWEAKLKTAIEQNWSGLDYRVCSLKDLKGLNDSLIHRITHRAKRILKKSKSS